MLKELIILMLMSITLSASPAEELFRDINTTYSKVNYQHIFKDLDNLTINSFENNSTQRMIKEDFESLLPNYMDNKDIFSESSLKKLIKENVGKPRLRMFISASLVYMKYLDEEGKTKDAENIMRRNLINFNSLMTKSDNIVDYIRALGLYKRTFTYMESSLQNMTGILEKHPPPNESIYFEKMKRRS